MVAVALRQVCASPTGNTGDVMKDTIPIYKSDEEFELQMGHSTFLTDEKVLFTYSSHPCAGRGDLGSGLINQSQNAMAAAMQIAEK